MVKITQIHLNQLFSQAVRELPHECCGILAGLKDGENFTVTGIYPMENIDKSAEHFTIDPSALFTLHRKLRSEGLTMLGNYHSHPSTPARPSQEDIRLAYDPGAVYIIISLLDAVPSLKAFSIGQGAYQELPVEII